MTDLEDRLRATYRAVAEQTVVAAEHPPLHVVTQLPMRTTVTRRRMAMALGVAACLAVAVVVVVTRHPAQPATDRVARAIAVPILVPQGYAFYDAGTSGSGGIPGFAGTYDGIHLVQYRKGSSGHFVLAATGDGDGALPAEGTISITLLSGVTALLWQDGDLSTLAWAQPDGPIVGIKANNVSVDDLASIANSVWYVTSSLFDELTAHGGFMATDDSNRLRDLWRIPGDHFAGSEMGVRGGLQSGLSIGWVDHTVGRGAVTDQCLAEPWRDGTRRLVVIGPGTTTEFVVHTPDGTVRVPAGNPPGLPTVAVAAVAAERGTVECIGGGL